MEVVVGLALMASLLVGALLAFSAHQKQLRRAEQQLAAVSIADELLNELSGRQEGIPKSGRGPVAKMTGWFWQTRVVGLASPAQVPLQVIRLDIVEIQIDGTLKIMTSVDVVEPIL